MNLQDIQEAIEHSNIFNTIFNSRYEIIYKDNGDLELESQEAFQMMPDIILKFKQDSERFWFEPTMVFPDIMYDEVSDDDDFEYYTKKWAQVAKICTYFMKHEFEFE